MARKNKAASQSKAESLTVRLDPKIRYGLDLLARKQRRNLSSVVEWALQKAINDPEEGLIEKHKDGSESHLLHLLWDVEEADRSYQLATVRPDLMTFEEEKLVKTVVESDYFAYLQDLYQDLIGPDPSKPSIPFHQKLRSHLRQHFDAFKKVSCGESGMDALPKPPRGWKPKQQKKSDHKEGTAA